MQTNFIIEILGIKDKHIASWDMRSQSTVFYVELIIAVNKQQCLICKKRTKRVHHYHTEHIQGPIILNKPVNIYFCPLCPPFLIDTWRG